MIVEIACYGLPNVLAAVFCFAQDAASWPMKRRIKPMPSKPKPKPKIGRPPLTPAERIKRRKATHARYYQKHKQRILDAQAAWKAANPEKVKAYMRVANAKRRSKMTAAQIQSRRDYQRNLMRRKAAAARTTNE